MFNDREIYVMDSDGTNPIRLTHNKEQDRFPSWSHDGRKISFWSNRDGNAEIYAMDPNGSNQTNLTNNPTKDETADWPRGFVP